jgi:hypothetical protein
MAWDTHCVALTAVTGQQFQIQVPRSPQQIPVVMATPVEGEHTAGARHHRTQPGTVPVPPCRTATVARGSGPSRTITRVHVDTHRGVKRLSSEGWCWVVILLLVFWPLCWLVRTTAWHRPPTRLPALGSMEPCCSA